MTLTAETLETLESIAKAAPSGRWEVWTSNSWRRVMAQSPNSVRTVQVIVPCVHPHDNHPDLMFGPGVKEWLEGFTPEVALALIAEVRRLQAHREGPGTPSARLNYIHGELNQRFPLAVDVFSSEPAEPKFIAAIDELIAEVRRLREGAALPGVRIESCSIPEAGFDIIRTEQRTGPAKWKVLNGGYCLTKTGDWEWEPLPSSRTDEFIERCRFNSAQEAIDAALNAARKEPK
jgi:hypothetical protein